MNKMLPFLTLLPLFGFLTKSTSATMVGLATKNDKPLPVSLRAGVTIGANNENKKLKLDDDFQEGAEEMQTVSTVEQQHSFLTNNKKENGASVHLSAGRHLQASSLRPGIIRRAFLSYVAAYTRSFIKVLRQDSPEIGRVTRTGIVLSGFRGRNLFPRGVILAFRSTRPVTVSGIRRTLDFLANSEDADLPASVRRFFLRGFGIDLGCNSSRRVRSFRVLARFNTDVIDRFLPLFDLRR